MNRGYPCEPYGSLTNPYIPYNLYNLYPLGTKVSLVFLSNHRNHTVFVQTMNKFRNSNGRRYLQGLFYETTLSDKGTVVYTLKEQDHEVEVVDQTTGVRERRTYPSLYRLYMEEADITEYTFATKHLDGWSHWQELCSARWFEPFLTAWRDELSRKLEALYNARMEAIAADLANKGALAANKSLLEGLRKPADAKKRGRPGKGSGGDAETHQRALELQIGEDAKRLGIN